MNIRSILSLAGAGTAGLALVALSAGAASAHVSVTPTTTSAGSSAVLTFSVGHGCEGSPTTKLAIALPESIPQVTPTINPGWDVEKVAEDLAEPITDSHGNEVTERVAQVVYTAKAPLADGFRDTVELSVQLPDAEGETLAFPVIQTCVEGESGWTQTAAEGQDPHDLPEPAPVITLTASADGGHADDGEGGDHDEDGHAEADAAAGSDDGAGNSTGLAVGGLVAGIGGLLLGGAALLRGRKQA